MSSSVLRSTSKNSSSGFCAFRTANVDAAAADSDAAAAEEKRRLPSARDRDSITAAAAACQHNGSRNPDTRRVRFEEVRGGSEREASEIPAAAAAASDPWESWGEGFRCERVFFLVQI